MLPKISHLLLRLSTFRSSLPAYLNVAASLSSNATVNGSKGSCTYLTLLFRVCMIA